MEATRLGEHEIQGLYHGRHAVPANLAGKIAVFLNFNAPCSIFASFVLYIRIFEISRIFLVVRTKLENALYKNLQTVLLIYPDRFSVELNYRTATTNY